MAIGGAIGGAVDPTKVYGPKIGDGQQQAATDGAPIAWVQGTAMIAGTIVQVSPRRQKRHKTGGKGGAPTQVTYTAQQDFAILVCESSQLRNSTINSILMVFQDGKLVYDVRPGSTILTQSAKWKANVDFLFGAEDQMPHPTLEAITGVGNTPAYRGSCIAVFKNFDVSSAGDRIPSFQFVVSSAPGLPAQSDWKYLQVDAADGTDYSGDSFDDSTWGSKSAPFGSWDSGFGLPDPSVWDVPHLFDSRFAEKFASFWAVYTRLWLRRKISVPTVPSGGFKVTGYVEDNCHFYVNGVLAFTTPPTGSDLGSGFVNTIAASYFREGDNTIAVRCDDEPGSPGGESVVYADLLIEPVGLAPNVPVPTPISSVALNLAKRGGLLASEVDVSGLDGPSCIGYPIARQANAADCLLPLLQAYFAYGCEYEAKLAFQFYGQDAAVTVNAADLLEGNDANSGAIKKNLRNQATEFPRRIVGKYMDPTQNYMTVTTAAERRSIDVIAIGDQSFDIPVVTSPDDAAQAVDKALKVAYATLEGKLEYSVPFAGSDVYIKLAAGEPVIFNGKRWVADEVILGTGYIKLTTRYDRQSAYTSNVQAILGNAPTPPSSPYSGPTTLVPMDLPALRPQDSFGVYLAAGSSNDSPDWRGCTVQISYDNQATWQTALTINGACTVGTIESASPFRVLLNNESLESATDAQLAANANVFGIVGANGVTELAQFATATSTGTALEYDLTSLNRGLAGSTVVSDPTGYRFATLDYAYFFPIDVSFAGRTLYLRAVGFGEDEATATIESLIFTARTYDLGTPLIAEDGTLLVAENDVDILYSEQTP